MTETIGAVLWMGGMVGLVFVAWHQGRLRGQEEEKERLMGVIGREGSKGRHEDADGPIRGDSATLESFPESFGPVRVRRQPPYPPYLPRNCLCGHPLGLHTENSCSGMVLHLHCLCTHYQADSLTRFT